MIYNIVRTRYSGTQFTIFPYSKDGNPYTLGEGEYFRYEIKDSPFTNTAVYSVEQTDTFFDASATTFANKMYFEILTIHYADAEGEYPADEVELLRGDLDLTDSEFNTNVFEKDDLSTIRNSLNQAQTNIKNIDGSWIKSGTVSLGNSLHKISFDANETILPSWVKMMNANPNGSEASLEAMIMSLGKLTMVQDVFCAKGLEVEEGIHTYASIYANGTINAGSGMTINTKTVDYVTKESSVDASTLDTNTTGTWYYRKWNSGRVEVWGYRITIKNLTWTEYTATSRASKTITIPLTINTLESATMNTNTATLFSGSTRQPTTKNKLVVNIWKSNDTTATTSCECTFNIIGR